jgi:acetoin utilization deacetylase AcuC-like enzyme
MAMTTHLYTHSSCVEHDPGEHHPESPDRLRAVLGALDAETFSLLERHEAPKAETADLERIHESFYVEALLKNVPKKGHVYHDPDTGMSPASGEAALRAAGAVCAAVDAVLAGKARNAFCAVRPPGHHAESSRAMGFCLFNNVAVGAERARAKHGLKKVAVVDFDVHHGNGTQHSFQQDRGLFYASSHQWPAYPGTGLESDRGVDNNICNVQLRPGSGSAEFRQRYEDTVLPRLKAFAPELLIISAGFDAHARDPLAQLRLQTDDYTWVTEALVKVANDCCQGRVVSSLEGGYDLEALAASAAAHVKVLMAA